MLPTGDDGGMEKYMILSIHVASILANLVSHFFLDVFQHNACFLLPSENSITIL